MSKPSKEAAIKSIDPSRLPKNLPSDYFATPEMHKFYEGHINTDLKNLDDVVSNVNKFVKAKSATVVSELDEARRLTPNDEEFNQMKDVILEKHFGNYMDNEVDYINRSTKSSAQIQEYTEEEEVPMLRYVAMMDGSTRPEHAALDGTTLPLDDPFWDDFTPPWDYGCRCRTVAEYGKKEVRKSHSEEPNEDVATPWKTGKCFSEENHPYFKNL